MPSTPPHDPHPACDLPDAARFDYACAVASLVALDGEAHDTELSRLRGLCEELNLSSEQTERVLTSAEKHDAPALESVLTRLGRDASLATALVTDALTIVFADGKLVDSEAEAVTRIAEKMGLTVGQTEMIARYVESVLLHAGDASHDHMAKELGELAAHRHHRSPSALRRFYDRIRGK